MHHYCTYFDSRFLVRGLALHRSMLRHIGDFTLHVLCLDDAAYEALTTRNEPTIRPIRLAELEAFDPQLLIAKVNRKLVEYYFTLTPALPLYVMNQTPDAAFVTYLDADLYFFANPAPIYQELGDGSVLIVPHRYSAALAHKAPLGIYNVGFNIFRNDARGRACLQWWRQRCLEWCHDRLEDGKYADQKYLDDWPTRFEGVVVCQNKGANLAPWNLANYHIARAGDRVTVDDEPLIFYHFHGLRILRSYLFDPSFHYYLLRPSAVVKRCIYGPYLREVRSLLKLADVGAIAQQHLRMAGRPGPRKLISTMLHGRTLLSVGPITTTVHGAPVAWPLLRLRELALRLFTM